MFLYAYRVCCTFYNPDNVADSSLSVEELKYIHDMPYFYHLPEFGVCIVHAGVLPNIPIESNDPNILMNIRTVLEDGSGTNDGVSDTTWCLVISLQINTVY